MHYKSQCYAPYPKKWPSKYYKALRYQRKFSSIYISPTSNSTNYIRPIPITRGFIVCPILRHRESYYSRHHGESRFYHRWKWYHRLCYPWVPCREEAKATWDAGTWAYQDWVFQRTWSATLSINKAREYGWTGHLDSYNSFVHAFEMFKSMGQIPSVWFSGISCKITWESSWLWTYPLHVRLVHVALYQELQTVCTSRILLEWFFMVQSGLIC